ncbi:unnamed protein product [Laminaria digitata]
MKLKDEFSLTYLFISHDLGVIQHVCDEIAVMYLGKIVEQGSRNDIFSEPLHPYTIALISAVPSALFSEDELPARIKLAGEPPSPIDIPPGCRFSGRCPFAIDICKKDEPELRMSGNGHQVACHRVSDAGQPEYRSS